jgi:hypothetical protein
MSNSREPSPEGDHPLPNTASESRRRIPPITPSHPQDFIGHDLPVQNNDPILQYLPLSVVIWCAVLIYRGVKLEAGCDFECMMKNIINMFNTRGGNGRTRRPRNKGKQRNMGNTRASKNKQGSFSKVLPKELLNLKIGNPASITKIKDWINKNKDNIKDEDLSTLLNNLLESKEYGLQDDEIYIPSSSETVKQFIVGHKKQFLRIIRKLV